MMVGEPQGAVSQEGDAVPTRVEAKMIQQTNEEILGFKFNKQCPSCYTLLWPNGTEPNSCRQCLNCFDGYCPSCASFLTGCITCTSNVGFSDQLDI